MFGLDFKKIFKKVGDVMTGVSFNDIADHKYIKNVDLTMWRKVFEWKEMYKGVEEEISYMTTKGVRKRIKKSLKMPRLVSTEMASLIFNEKCEINLSCKEANKYIEQVLIDSKFYSQFQSYLEYMFALGGIVLKPYYCEDSKKIKIGYVTADSFIILRARNGEVQDIVFINDEQIDGVDYTHLEFHFTRGSEIVVEHELYRNNTGSYSKVDLGILSKNLTSQISLEGVSTKLFVYIKPNIANNFKVQSAEGISLFANSKDVLGTLDRAYDSLELEFKLGKKRIFVSSDLVKTINSPTGETHRYFDTEDEVYEVFKSSPSAEGSPVKEVDMTLRVEEHISAMNAMFDILSEQTGFNVGTFTMNKNSVKTATEVISENSKTFKSKRSHEVVLESALQELVTIILELAEYYDLNECANKDEITTAIKFDDSIVEDYSTDIDHQAKLLNMKVQTRKRSIMKLHKVTEEEAIEMMKEIDEDEFIEDSL